MYLDFFGGADEIGASSMLLKINGHRILVDAGIRMGSELELPDFKLDELKLLDAVLLTHAHSDHTGALPVLGRRLPQDVPIYCTPPTRDIAEILLKDRANREAREAQNSPKQKARRAQKHEPSYTVKDVEKVLGRVQAVQWEEPEEICEGVTAQWIRAGHILGAAMIYIKSGSERILITGDVCGTSQLTVPGLEVPSWLENLDVMVMESTYGNRRNKSGRKRIANKLVRRIKDRIAGGGKVLIPVFSVGRAQEVILILQDAIERKKIRDFPVYVDGMVRDVNRIYSDFVHEFPELPKSLRGIIASGKNLFASGFIKKVSSRRERKSIWEGEPCVIVASAGMLNGGASTEYADHLVSSEKNLIAITGYQAKGTPGRDLVDKSVWKSNNGKSVEVKCQVEEFRLSAHANGDQLLKLVEKVQPHSVYLVHGEHKAREELRGSIEAGLEKVNVVRPENGETHCWERWNGIAEGRNFRGDKSLSEISDFLRKESLERPLHILELASIWFGTEAITPIKVKSLEWCLKLNTRFFELKSDGFVYLR